MFYFGDMDGPPSIDPAPATFSFMTWLPVGAGCPLRSCDPCTGSDLFRAKTVSYCLCPSTHPGAWHSHGFSIRAGRGAWVEIHMHTALQTHSLGSTMLFPPKFQFPHLQNEEI